MTKYLVNCEGEVIAKAETKEALLKEAVSYYEGSDFEVAGLNDYQHGDCWLKVHNEPSENDLAFFCRDFPIDPADLVVQRPGTHPGGNAWWIQISAEMFEAEIKEAQESV